MLKVLIWVVSEDTRFFNGAINILERQHNGVELVGLTASREIGLVKDGRNVPFIPLERLTGGGKRYSPCRRRKTNRHEPNRSSRPPTQLT